MHSASFIGRLDEVIEMTENNMDVNAQNEHGVTPIMAACLTPVQYDKEQLTIINHLLSKGALLDIRNNEGRSVMYYALCSRYRGEIAKRFLECGADVNMLFENELKTLTEEVVVSMMPYENQIAASNQEAWKKIRLLGILH
jgi:ankyrin repeat protein